MNASAPKSCMARAPELVLFNLASLARIGKKSASSWVIQNCIIFSTVLQVESRELRGVSVQVYKYVQLGKKLKHEKLEETKHGLFRDCFLGAPE